MHQVSGTLLQDYRHPGPVYGCDWRDADTLATGCEDGRIRIYNVTKNKKEPITELKGDKMMIAVWFSLVSKRTFFFTAVWF